MHDWVELVLPLIAEIEGDVLGRAPGELLWPERFTERDFPSVERGEISSRSWSALYAQRPMPLEGGAIKAEWLMHYYDVVPDDLYVTMAIDCANKTQLEHDRTAMVVLGSDKKSQTHLVLHVETGRWDFPRLRDATIRVAEPFRPRAIYIEDAAAGTQLVQTLKAETMLPIIPVIARGSKLSRVEAQTGLIESGRVLLPNERKIVAAWLPDFVRECLMFPGGKRDDQVDALTLALSQARNSKYRPPGYWVWFLEHGAHDGNTTTYEAWAAVQAGVQAGTIQPAFIAQDYPARGRFGLDLLR